MQSDLESSERGWLERSRRAARTLTRRRWRLAVTLVTLLALLSCLAEGPPMAVGALAAGPQDAPGTITEYPLAVGSRPFGLTAGPDGALWFTMLGGQCEDGPGNKVGRITVDGTITDFPLPPRSYPGGITVGPDGALWIGLQLTNRVGRMQLDGRLTHQHPVPAVATARFPAFGCEYRTSRPAEGDMVVGPDGALWFGESAGNNIARITIGGAVTEFPIPTPNSNPLGMTVGPDGALWFVERMASKIGRITTGGAITEYPLPNPDSFPNGIAAGPDGALWFTELRTDRVGRITTGGVLTEYPVTGLGPAGNPLARGGALWLTGTTSNDVVRLTTDGRITDRYRIPTPGSNAFWLVAGPDGNLWFTESSGHKIGRLLLQPPGAPAQLPRTGGPPGLLLLAVAALLLAAGLGLRRRPAAWTALVALLGILTASCLPAAPATPTDSPIPPTATTARPTGATAPPTPTPPTLAQLAFQRTADRVKGLVDVGGDRLYVDCTGAGRPTVVLDAGAGGDSSVWRPVQRELAKSTQVCAYDRANRGSSDEGPIPNTAEQMVRDLHTLLANAEIAGPYVLVGQSFGGLVAQLFAIRYPAETAGLVLVDSAHAKNYTQEPRWLAVPILQGVDMVESGKQVLTAGPLPRRPLVVLSRGLPFPEGAASEEVWAGWQRELAAAVPGSRHIVVEKASHNIHNEQPAVVVDAVLQVVREAGR